MKLYERLRSLEKQGKIKCTGECKHCPYEHALRYAGNGCDVYYDFRREGIKLSKNDGEHLSALEEEHSMLLHRCETLKARHSKVLSEGSKA